MEIIFDLPRIGNLTLEHTFYMYEEPILFVCTDSSQKRFLCSCCRLSEKWVVAQVDEEDLIKLIDDRITIREIFELRDNLKFLIIWDGESFSLESDVPCELFPKVGAKLELEYERGGAYQNLLKQNAEQKALFRTLTEVSNVICKSFSTSLQITAPLMKETQMQMVNFITGYRDAFQTYQKVMSASVIMQRAGEIENINNVVKADAILSQLQSEPAITRKPQTYEQFIVNSGMAWLAA